MSCCALALVSLLALELPSGRPQCSDKRHLTVLQTMSSFPPSDNTPLTLPPPLSRHLPVPVLPSTFKGSLRSLVRRQMNHSLPMSLNRTHLSTLLHLLIRPSKTITFPLPLQHQLPLAQQPLFPF